MSVSVSVSIGITWAWAWAWIDVVPDVGPLESEANTLNDERQTAEFADVEVTCV
jgi:hypothetical protein